MGREPDKTQWGGSLGFGGREEFFMADDQATVADGMMVAVHYTLCDGDNNTLDSSLGGDPLQYIQGMNGMVPGLEQALEGKGVGFKERVEVPPALGYGERADVPPQVVPRQFFPANLRLEPGMNFVAEGPEGQRVSMWVLAPQGNAVLVDMQHPLAGVTLHFDVEIVAIREATQKERELAEA